MLFSAALGGGVVAFPLDQGAVEFIGFRVGDEDSHGIERSDRRLIAVDGKVIANGLGEFASTRALKPYQSRVTSPRRSRVVKAVDDWMNELFMLPYS